jgi:hypothetical protein
MRPLAAAAVKLILAALFVFAGAAVVGIAAAELGLTGSFARMLPVFLAWVGVVWVAMRLFREREDGPRPEDRVRALRGHLAHGELRPDPALDLHLAWAPTGRDRLDAYEIERREATGMRPWVRGFVIAMGAIWLAASALFAAAAVQDPPRDPRPWIGALIPLLAGGGILWLFVVRPIRARRALRGAGAASSGVSLHATARGLAITRPGGGTAERRWSEVSLFRATRRTVHLGLAYEDAIVVPRAAFADDAERARFLDLVATRLAQEELLDEAEEPEHPLLAARDGEHAAGPWTLGELRLQPVGADACIDLTLRRGAAERRLRLLRPLQIEVDLEELRSASPAIRILSLPRRAFDGVGVRVVDEELRGRIHLLAEDVVELGASPVRPTP